MIETRPGASTPAGLTSDDTMIDVRNLRTHFHTETGIVRAVDDVSFSIRAGETVGLVGESGCGKSMTSLSLMQLVPRPRGRIVDGSILYRRRSGDPVDIAALEPYSTTMRSIRGNEMAMIFQEPMTSLNPVFTIGAQISEAVRLHQMLGREKAKRRALEMLKRVNIAKPDQRINEYPHQLSGGMRQRAMIAMALSCNPKFLVADEPTTALDVTIEAQILKLMRELQREFGMAILFITHDLGVVAEMARRVLVMYTGKIVEEAPTAELFRSPKHPYTMGLLQSIPRIGRKERLTPISGTVPSLERLPKGCTFAPRCPFVFEKCRHLEPPLFRIGETRTVKCWLYEDVTEGGQSPESRAGSGARAGRPEGGGLGTSNQGTSSP